MQLLQAMQGQQSFTTCVDGRTELLQAALSQQLGAHAWHIPTAHPAPDVALGLCLHLLQDAILFIPEPIVVRIDVLVHLVPCPPQLQAMITESADMLSRARAVPCKDPDSVEQRMWLWLVLYTRIVKHLVNSATRK